MLIPKGQKSNRMKPGRIKDKGHLAYVAGFPCCCCGVKPVVCHHLLRADPKRGMGRKAGDNFVIPMCPMCHQKLHLNGNEIEFLDLYGVNGLEIAQTLWETSHEKD